MSARSSHEVFKVPVMRATSNTFVRVSARSFSGMSECDDVGMDVHIAKESWLRRVVSGAIVRVKCARWWTGFRTVMWFRSRHCNLVCNPKK